MADQATAEALPQAAVENIETVVRLRQEAWEQRSFSERIADQIGTFAGRMTFVGIHLAWFFAWAAFNTRLVSTLPVFDPYPFPLFGTIVSFEAVLISAFVLIKQNRMSQLNERRAHVELQVTLLLEKEVTKLLHIMERTASHLGIADETIDDETRELRACTEVEAVTRAVSERLPEP